jgi:hypothetical protein
MIKVKINKIINIKTKKIITELFSEDFNSHLNILSPNGAPARSRTQNLLVRSQALYPIELQALIINIFNYIVLSLFEVIC